MSKTPSIASDAVLLASESLDADTPQIGGYDFNKGINYEALLKSYMTIGFQASNFAMAVEELNRMLSWRLSDEPCADNEDDDMKSPEARGAHKCTIYLGYTSNMISCGVRDIIRFLCEHKLVDAIVTTGGGIEEDFMKVRRSLRVAVGCFIVCRCIIILIFDSVFRLHTWATLIYRAPRCGKRASIELAIP